jgi:uncharacterized membrane protein
MLTRIPSAFIMGPLFCIFVVFIVIATVGATLATPVTYPEKIFAGGKARHFIYKTEDGIAIRYFILKSSDGVFRVAFDACDVCWSENKGYSQKGDFMVCNNCGKRFPSARINEIRGGCNPAPLNHKVENGNVIIQVTDLLEGKRYFDFRGAKR